MLIVFSYKFMIIKVTEQIIVPIIVLAAYLKVFKNGIEMHR